MLKKFLAAAILPAEVTDFEREYLERMNRLTLWFFVAHLPVFTAVAYFNDTQPVLAVVLTLATLIGPIVAQRTFKQPRHISVVYGFTAMIMGGLLVHFGQGPIQIEMHFYFFALLAMLALYGNPAVILTAAVTVALHHLILWAVLPQSVFNYDAPIWVVLVHAAFVVLESVATCFIARSFFDNVIGLEKIVRARTQELDARNEDMRLVLDNVAQGFLTINRDGVMSEERSAIVGKWFGKAPADGQFASLLEKEAPSTACSFRMGWEQVLDGFMPLELTLDQLVSEIEVDGQHFRLGYQPIGSDEEDFDKMLIVISDVTADIERARLQEKQQEVMQIFERVMRDKNGFLEFYEEACDLIEKITSRSVSNLTVVKRMLHTLKGNAMIFGINTIAAHCHQIEDAVIDSGTVPDERQLHALSGRWTELREDLEMLLGERAGRNIEIDDEEYAGILRDLVNGAPRETLARRIADWRLEPTKRRLDRIAEQAQRIANRLNKGEIALEVEDNDLRLAPERWAPFWSSFVHVVRNAVDHGLESADERERSGKPARGLLRVATRMETDTFVISLTDDGRGIDWNRVAERARAAGLPIAGARSLEAALFQDGVTTASEVTEFSGRGVGMAAVKSACTARGGEIRVHSAPGEGTCVEFRFPSNEMAEDPVALYRAA